MMKISKLIRMSQKRYRETGTWKIDLIDKIKQIKQN